MTKHVIVNGGNVAVLHFSYIPLSHDEKRTIQKEWEYLFGENSPATDEERKSAKIARHIKFDKLEVFLSKKQCKIELSQSDLKKIHNTIIEGCAIEYVPLTIDYYC